LRPGFGIEEPRRAIVSCCQQNLPVGAKGEDDDFSSILPQLIQARLSALFPLISFRSSWN
jgi:hypothetical protein